MDNMTLRISEDGDLVIGRDGVMETISGVETTAQNIRMTLKAGKNDFPLVQAHGTDYAPVFRPGMDEETIREAYREAIFQETDVAQLNGLSIERDKREREIKVSFEAVTEEGQEVNGST